MWTGAWTVSHSIPSHTVTDILKILVSKERCPECMHDADPAVAQRTKAPAECVLMLNHTMGTLSSQAAECTGYEGAQEHMQAAFLARHTQKPAARLCKSINSNGNNSAADLSVIQCFYCPIRIFCGCKSDCAKAPAFARSTVYAVET